MSSSFNSHFSQLVTYNNAEVEMLLRNFHFVIVPVMNPDGYEYTHKSVSKHRLLKITLRYFGLRLYVFTKV